MPKPSRMKRREGTVSLEAKICQKIVTGASKCATLEEAKSDAIDKSHADVDKHYVKANTWPCRF